MSDHDPDKLDDAWLDELYQASGEDLPPPALDRAILAQAAKKGQAPVWRKWSASLATAAVVILTAGVFLNQVLVAPAPESVDERSSSQFQTTAEMLHEPATQPQGFSAEELRESASSPQSYERKQSQNRPAPAVADAMVAAPKRPATRTPEPEMLIEEIVVTAAHRTEALASAPETAAEKELNGVASFGQMMKKASKASYSLTEECIANETCVRTINHPQCDEPFVLSDEATDLVTGKDGVDYHESNKHWRLSCIYQDWTKTILDPEN